MGLEHIFPKEEYKLYHGIFIQYLYDFISTAGNTVFILPTTRQLSGSKNSTNVILQVRTNIKAKKFVKTNSMCFFGVNTSINVTSGKLSH